MFGVRITTMSFSRKLRRKGKYTLRCCGSQMTYKDGYGYVCEKCGKVRNDKRHDDREV